LNFRGNKACPERPACYHFSRLSRKTSTNKHRMNPELANFATRLREDISDCQFPVSDLPFAALAEELFALQFKHNAAYRKICEARYLTPQTVGDWTQIPAVPTGAFKELELTSLALAERTAVFHSSGTTEQKPSRHFHSAESLVVYEASLWHWFKQNCQLPIANCQLICLTPPPVAAPHSSLVHMFEVIRQKTGEASLPASCSPFVGKLDKAGAWTLDLEAAVVALSDNSKLKTQNSKLILGTAFSFVHLLDYLAENNLSFRLPPGSRVMETGGYKNRSRSLPKAELHALIEKHLGVPRENIICEYGMSELSSQAYAVTSEEWRVVSRSAVAHHSSLITHHFRFPPWARVQIISPEAGREVADGETGLIRIFDLANVFSVAAIQTEDLGVRRGDGFELVGRAQFAEPRGCSLMTV
jgi:Acyl-protein synthetase, LuxE